MLYMWLSYKFVYQRGCGPIQYQYYTSIRGSNIGKALAEILSYKGRAVGFI